MWTWLPLSISEGLVPAGLGLGPHHNLGPTSLSTPCLHLGGEVPRVDRNGAGPGGETEQGQGCLGGPWSRELILVKPPPSWALVSSLSKQSHRTHFSGSFSWKQGERGQALPSTQTAGCSSAPSLFPLYSSPGSPWRPPLSASLGSRRVSREIERSSPGKRIPTSLGRLTLEKGYPRQPASGPGSGFSSDRSEK